MTPYLDSATGSEGIRIRIRNTNPNFNIFSSSHKDKGKCVDTYAMVFGLDTQMGTTLTLISVGIVDTHTNKQK